MAPLGDSPLGGWWPLEGRLAAAAAAQHRMLTDLSHVTQPHTTIVSHVSLLVNRSARLFSTMDRSLVLHNLFF